GVAQRPDERDCNDEVAESEPVRTVADERIFGLGCDDAVANFSEPAEQAWLFQVGAVVRTDDSSQQVEFALQRDRRYSADDQASDEDPKQNANATLQGCRGQRQFRLRR